MHNFIIFILQIKWEIERDEYSGDSGAQLVPRSNNQIFKARSEWKYLKVHSLVFFLKVI